MREIKFRAWDKKRKEMLHKPILFPKREGGGQAVSGNGNQYELMQFTGLKDKNGKEIYEGDIVKWGHHCEWCKEEPIRIAEVQFAPDIQFKTLIYDEPFRFGSFAYKDTYKHLEIIGNIYENPELLK